MDEREVDELAVLLTRLLQLLDPFHIKMQPDKRVWDTQTQGHSLTNPSSGI